MTTDVWGTSWGRFGAHHVRRHSEKSLPRNGLCGRWDNGADGGEFSNHPSITRALGGNSLICPMCPNVPQPPTKECVVAKRKPRASPRSRGSRGASSSARSPTRTTGSGSWGAPTAPSASGLASAAEAALAQSSGITRRASPPLDRCGGCHHHQAARPGMRLRKWCVSTDIPLTNEEGWRSGAHGPGSCSAETVQSAPVHSPQQCGATAVIFPVYIKRLTDRAWSARSPAIPAPPSGWPEITHQS